MKYYSMYTVYCVYIESPISKILKALQGGWMVYEILMTPFPRIGRTSFVCMCVFYVIQGGIFPRGGRGKRDILHILYTEKPQHRTAKSVVTDNLCSMSVLLQSTYRRARCSKFTVSR